MKTYRTVRTHTAIPTRPLRDETLSLGAVGLFTKVMSLANNGGFTLGELVENCKEGKTSVVNALNELESHGYIALKGEAGHDKFYEIYEFPQDVERR